MPELIRTNVDASLEVARLRNDIVATHLPTHTSTEAVENVMREQAKRLWEAGMPIADISRVQQVSVFNLKKWQELDQWPSKEDVKANVGDTHRHRVKRMREVIQLEHLEKQNKILHKGYDILEEAAGQINKSEDPVRAAASLVKAAATHGDHFIKISGLNAPEEKKPSGKQGLNLLILTDGSKTAQATTTPAPYEET